MLDLHLFYLLVYLNTTGMPDLKFQGDNIDPEYHLMWLL
jgi:hypothetical protein